RRARTVSAPASSVIPAAASSPEVTAAAEIYRPVGTASSSGGASRGRGTGCSTASSGQQWVALPRLPRLPRVSAVSSCQKDARELSRGANPAASAGDKQVVAPARLRQRYLDLGAAAAMRAFV